MEIAFFSNFQLFESRIDQRCILFVAFPNHRRLVDQVKKKNQQNATHVYFNDRISYCFRCFAPSAAVTLHVFVGDHANAQQFAADSTARPGKNIYLYIWLLSFFLEKAP